MPWRREISSMMPANAWRHSLLSSLPSMAAQLRDATHPTAALLKETHFARCQGWFLQTFGGSQSSSVGPASRGRVPVWTLLANPKQGNFSSMASMFTLLGRARSAGLSMEPYSPILSRLEYAEYVYPTQAGAPASLSREPYSPILSSLPPRVCQVCLPYSGRRSGRFE